MPFIPWDATEEEIHERFRVREQIPDTLRPALLKWLSGQLADRGRLVDGDSLLWVQTSLQEDLEWDGDDEHVDDVIETIQSRSDRFLLRVVDLLLSNLRESQSVNSAASAFEDLEWHLDHSRSSVCIVTRDDAWRLSHRLPEGTEELVQEAATVANTSAGSHLAAAWRKAFDFDADPSGAMFESIRAVEAAAGPVVTPKDERAQLSKIVATLKSQQGWGLVLRARDDGHPDHVGVLIGMLETLAFAQRDRHPGAAPPSVEEARAHAQLASTLVGWFATGVVRRAPSA